MLLFVLSTFVPVPATASDLDWANRVMATDPRVRATAEAALVQGAERSLPLLRRFLARGDEDLNLRTFKIIQRIGPPAIPLLVDLLRHEQASFRRSALNELIDLAPDTESIQPALRRALGDADVIVAGDAARALGALGPRASPSVSALVKTLSHADPYVRIYAAEALASIGPKAAGATRALAQALGDPIPGVRWAAGEALASIGPAAQSAVPQLIEALKDEFLYVRICAAGALGSIGPKARAARGALRAAASDPTMRSEAEWALDRIAGVGSRETVLSPAPPAPSVLTTPSVAPRTRTTAAPTGHPPVDWDTTTGRNVVWSVELGHETFGRPVVAGGVVYVGTDNGRQLNPAFQEEGGVLMAFRATDGGFLWQDVAPRVERGLREFLLPSTTSAPYVEGNRLYYVTAECQLRSLDTQGFRDGENSGPYRDEVFKDDTAADVVWELDICGRLGVFPHEATNSEVLPVGDLLLVCTSNGQNEGHTRVPSPRAPSLIAVDKHSGEVVWRAVGAGEHVLHGQWCSPVAARRQRSHAGALRRRRRLAARLRRRVGSRGLAIRRQPEGCPLPTAPRRPFSRLHHRLAGLRGRPRLHCHGAETRRTATDLRWFMRSVPAARRRHRRAGASGRPAMSAAWWARPSRRTACCTSGTWAARFIAWTRPPAPRSGSTRRTRPSGDASWWPATASTSATSTAA